MWANFIKDQIIIISLDLTTRDLFHQGIHSCDISSNKSSIEVFENPRHKTQFVHLARQVYKENISMIHKTYIEACKEPQLFLIGSNTID